MQGNILRCQLIHNLLESFNSHKSVFDIRCTSVPSFPCAWLLSYCWTLAWLSDKVAQMVFFLVQSELFTYMINTVCPEIVKYSIRWKEKLKHIIIITVNFTMHSILNCYCRLGEIQSSNSEPTVSVHYAALYQESTHDDTHAAESIWWDKVVHVEWTSD